MRFGLVHKFLWDRYRSVRQDLYIQGISDDFAVGVYEEIVRFHVMCEHELCGEDQSGEAQACPCVGLHCRFLDLRNSGWQTTVEVPCCGLNLT